MKFSIPRTLRLVAWLAVIILGTWYVCDYVAGDKHDVIDTGENFTTYCLKIRSGYIDKNRITDLNCSLENNQKRVFITMSEQGLADMNREFPVRHAVYSCRDGSVKQLLLQSAADNAESLADSYLDRHQIKKLCTHQSVFHAENLELEYVDRNNSLQKKISILYDR